MGLESNRLLLLLEQTLKEVNREIIDAEFEKLTINDLKPVLNLVARTRADYLKDLFAVADEFPDGLPPADRVEQLKHHRVRYEELVFASRALETAIERNYLSVLQS